MKTAQPKRRKKNELKNKTAYFIGTAGWTIPKELAKRFPPEGSHLQRYSQILTGVEINSSFYRPHQAKTYKRWADETHANLRFAVKMTKEFTHVRKLEIEPEEFADWFAPVSELGPKLGAILVQLPPKLEFTAEIANRFFKSMRAEYRGLIALEPRHISWTGKEPQKLLEVHRVTKVEADPERCPSPIDRTQARYIRLHGSPQIYKSLYEPDVIKHWANELAATDESSWVIFDNTTFGHATTNALELLEKVSKKVRNKDGTQVASDDSASSNSRKFSRRKRGAITNIVPTVTKLMTAPKTAD